MPSGGSHCHCQAQEVQSSIKASGTDSISRVAFSHAPFYEIFVPAKVLIKHFPTSFLHIRLYGKVVWVNDAKKETLMEKLTSSQSAIIPDGLQFLEPPWVSSKQLLFPERPGSLWSLCLPNELLEPDMPICHGLDAVHLRLSTSVNNLTWRCTLHSSHRSPHPTRGYPTW